MFVHYSMIFPWDGRNKDFRVAVPAYVKSSFCVILSRKSHILVEMLRLTLVPYFPKGWDPLTLQNYYRSLGGTSLAETKSNILHLVWKLRKRSLIGRYLIVIVIGSVLDQWEWLSELSNVVHWGALSFKQMRP